MSDKKSYQSILILTLSAGGGHLQAAKVKVKESKESFPNARVVVQDTFINWLGKRIGKLAAHLWSGSQAKSRLLILGFFSFAISYVDLLFMLPIGYIRTRSLIKKHNLDLIIDTQPLGTAGVIKAIRHHEKKTGKRIAYRKVLTDLPTKYTRLYFKAISFLSKKDKPYLSVITTIPLLEENETERSFWEEKTKLPFSQIHYAPFPLRTTIQHYAKHPINKANPIDIRFATNSPRNAHLISNICSYGNITATRDKDDLTCHIPPEARVSLFFMGTFPNQSVLEKYIKSVISLKQESLHNDEDYLFIFCNSPSDQKCVLQETLRRLLPSIKEYPKNLSIIPLPYQEDIALAPLMSRSDATISKSGGATAMELFMLSRGTIWIHQDTIPWYLPKWLKKSPFFKYGMPLWEAGNTYYLNAHKNAKFITPDSFKTVAKEFYSTPFVHTHALALR